MKSTFLTLATLVACVSQLSTFVSADNYPHLYGALNANPPVGTAGHTAVLIKNIVYIQGGRTKSGISSASYAITLNPDGGMDNSTSKADVSWLDTTKIANLGARDFFVSVPFQVGNTNESAVHCGSMDGSGSMTCTIFDTYLYNTTRSITLGQPNFGRMAYTEPNSKNEVFIFGGTTDSTLKANVSNAGYKLSVSGTSLQLESVTARQQLLVPLIDHTATWIELSNVTGTLILGGRNPSNNFLGMFTMLVSDQATIWPNLGDEGITASGRYGHTATYIPDKSSVYVFGGFSAGTNVIMNDMFALDLRTRSWTKIVPSGGVAPEYRAFHTATLISKNTKILYAFGQNGNNQDVLSNTYSIYDITTNTWSKAVAPVVVLEITHSPFIDTTPPPVDFLSSFLLTRSKVPATNNTVPSSNPTNPNDGTNNSDNPTNKASPGINIAMIGGICGGVVLLILLIILAIILIRRRNRRPVRNFTPAPLPPKDMKILYKNGGDDDEEDEKKAKAFMIRRPPSVYMDEQDGDGDIPHPHYKSQYYGSSNGRNSPSIAEYELTTSGGGSGGAANTLSMVSSVAERRRYVEAQQQQFIDDYENTYKHPPPFEPNSKEERNWDSEDDEPLPRKTNQTNSRAGPRYPQAQNGRNPSSNYDLDDYI